MKKTEETSEIDLHIDNYDYIFSDFDSRPYSRRLISVDLIEEMNRAVKDKKSDSVEIKFFIHPNKRDDHKEIVIKKRLKEYFNHNYTDIKKDKSAVLKEGLLFVLLGIFFMIIATFFLIKESSYLITFLAVLSEPAGWFLFWEGLNLIIFDVKKKIPEMKFYRKMTNSRISFVNYK